MDKLFACLFVFRSERGERHGELVKQYKQMKTRAKKLEAFHKEEAAKFAQQVQANVRPYSF